MQTFELAASICLKKATVITVVHEYAAKDDRGSHRNVPAWNSVICFKAYLRELLETELGEGEPVHLTGTVRTNTFQGEYDEKWRAVVLLVSTFDVLQKNISSPADD